MLVWGMTGCEIDWDAAAALGSLGVAILALVLPWRGRVVRQVGDRLGARNVHFFAWRMIDDILAAEQVGRPRRRSTMEFEAVERGLDAVELTSLDPAHLIGSAIELRYAWNVAKAPGEVGPAQLMALRVRAARAMDSFDREIFADGAQFDGDQIAKPHRWNRPLIAMRRWALHRLAPPYLVTETGSRIGKRPATPKDGGPDSGA